MTGIEEIEYGRALQEESSIRQLWMDLEAEKSRARKAQSAVVRREDWEAYEAYRRGLEMRQSHIERQWTEAKMTLEHQQEKLRMAFVDEKTWDKIVERTFAEVSAAQARQDQAKADEDAMLRFGKADSR